MTNDLDIYSNNQPIGDGWADLRSWLYGTNTNAVEYVVIERGGLAYPYNPAFILDLFEIEHTNKAFRRLNNIVCNHFRNHSHAV